jgi:multiple RNA-binding domain-containing protein 1
MEEDLFEKFSEFGHVTSVHIPVDDSKRNKGYAFINFESKDDAKLAMDTMDGEDFQGRLIHILPSRPAADQMNNVYGSDLTYKERQDLVRQKEAEKSSKGCSASFLRGDAVVDNLSDRLGISKGDILNVKDGISSGNAAVRLALGETHVISENIAFFEDHGVDVVALEVKSNKIDGGGGAPTRSKTMILVKNLPYDTSLEDLTKVFHDIGGDVPQKILLPPSKTAALVEYAHATDARRAFRKLAYKKFKHVPLYLEWAPMKAGGKQIPPPEDTTVDAPNQGSSDFVVKPGFLEEDPSMETADTGASQTVYVKNLSFATSEDQLEQAFARAGIQPRAVKIPTKAAPMKRHAASPAADSSVGNNDVRRLSMGFGFVEFPSEAEALKAMKALQGKVVDGHSLELKLSTKSLSSTKKSAADKPSNSTKIMIRNVPFEATRTELLQLFGSFGQLKKVRLPKKFDGTHRGFAFCEFATSKEAQNAMTALSRTHLYGRHLVLEWAEAADEDGNGKVDVDVIREKTKRDVKRAGLGGTGKKAKHLKF